MRSKTVRKVWYDFLDNNKALTMAIADIKDNYEFYRERYLKWLKEKEIVEYLRGHGFKEISAAEKKSKWYKKASEKTKCQKKESHTLVSA